MKTLFYRNEIAATVAVILIKDIAWIDFIKHLKDTGMPIKEIKRYAALRAAGESPLAERMKMLIHHRQALGEQITQLQEHMAKLDDKIIFYRMSSVVKQTVYIHGISVYNYVRIGKCFGNK